MIVDQAAKRKQTFIVETHSDHLVDRIRMDVRKRGRAKTLAASDVIILYFERQGGKATIHPIELDDNGDLVGVPPGYRQFFLDEERKLLGLAHGFSGSKIQPCGRMCVTLPCWRSRVVASTG